MLWEKLSQKDSMDTGGSLLHQQVREEFPL